MVATLTMILALLVTTPIYNLAYLSAQSKPPTVPAMEYPCASNSSLLDQLNLEARESGATVMIISRLGNGERSRKLAMRRLRVAREYVYLEDTRVVLKEGVRVRGAGCLEFYLDDRLFFVSEMLKGYEFCPND
jgi:hypothetical protein